MSTYKDVEPIIEKLKYEMEAESKVWTDYDKSMIDVGLRVAMDIIREQSTADVVEVVRCRDCVNRGPFVQGKWLLRGRKKKRGLRGAKEKEYEKG